MKREGVQKLYFLLATTAVAHLASYPMGAEEYFPGRKAAGDRN
jgi:hypothetical protein